MESASLQITCDAGTLTFVWTAPGGAVLRRSRSVHPDDLSAARTALDHPPESLDALESLGRRLYSRLFEREVREAVFSTPSCLLTLETNLPEIPWELVFGEGRFLADAHAVGRAQSVKAAPRAHVRGDLRVLMVVNPTGDLPYSDSEAAQITERLRHVGRVRIETLAGATATRDAILEALETRPFDAVHFSCHAEHDAESPERSHVRAYDGPLTAEDLYQAAMLRPPVLWVLNACESGRCAGTGSAAGLGAALRGAGASAVVAALWPVNNKCAGHAMTAMYAALLSGDTIGEAVRAARAQTRQVFSQDPMLTWAAFTLSGSPARPLISAETRVRLGRAPLVGRDAEWAALVAAWADARAGRFRGVLVAGGPGSGKTRLVDEWLASVPEAPVLTFEPDGGVGEAMARAGIALSGEVLPARSAEAVADWAGARGGIVVCDGLDRAAPGVVNTVHAVAIRSADTPLLLLATAEGARMAEVLPREAMQVVTLHPLGREELARVFDALGGRPPDGLEQATPGEAERMAMGLPSGETPGALADALPEDARSALRAGAVVGEAFTISDVAALLDEPEKALWRPLDRLCGTGWLVETAPGRFRFRNAPDRLAILHAFHPLGERHALHRRQAARCEAAERFFEAGGHWELSGDGERAAAAYRSAFLRAARAGDASDILTASTRLADLGMEPDDAFSLRAIAGACGETGDWAAARRYWERALDATPEPERADVLVRLAEVEARGGAMEAAERRLLEAESVAGGESAAADVLWAEILLARCLPHEALERARAGLREPGLAARAALAGANAALMLPDPEQAAAMCRAGLEAGDGEACRAALTRTLARSRQYAGDYEAAEAALLALRDEQREMHRPHERAATLLALAELWRDQGQLDPALASADEARTLGERCGQPSLVADAENLRCSILRRQGKYGPALEAASRAGETARAAGLAPASIHAQVLTATVLVEQGQLAAARASVEAAATSAEAADYGYGLAWAKTILGNFYLDMGDPESARPLLESALQVAQAIRGHIGISNALYSLGRAAWDEGRPDESLFAQAEEGAASISYRAIQGPAAFGRALCAGDIEASEAALREVEALNMGALAAWLRARRGAYHLDRGDHEAALRDFASAYRVARRLGMRVLQARAADALARLYDETGDPMAGEMRAESETLWSDCLAGF